MYSIGPVSNASLFQILLEKLVAVARRYGAPAPLYVMTSPATHDETVAYFSQQQRFGLVAENVHYFCQGQMPSVDAASGRALLAKKGQVALSPDGHGGMLAALARSGGLDDIRRAASSSCFISRSTIRSWLMCDPLFVGYHILSHSEMSMLAISKRDPAERVGNVVQIDGRSRVIEYSDFPAGRRRAAQRRRLAPFLGRQHCDPRVRCRTFCNAAAATERTAALPRGPKKGDICRRGWSKPSSRLSPTR